MRRLAALRRWWTELDQLGTPKFGEMGTQVQNLRNILAEHFAAEEKDGYLAPVIAVAPYLSRQANELQSQHGHLLESLNDFISRLQMSEPPFESWQAAYRELETLLLDLRRHEQAENEAVQAAFGNDVAAAD
jgi:iron-sulfur cluster repair protein YtfE (RIC family)